MNHLYIFIQIFIEKEFYEYPVTGVGPVFTGLTSLNYT